MHPCKMKIFTDSKCSNSSVFIYSTFIFTYRTIWLRCSCRFHWARARDQELKLFCFCQALNPHIVILSAQKAKELFVSQYCRGVLPRGCTDCLQDVGNQRHDQSPGWRPPRFLSAACIILPSALAKLEFITVACTLNIQRSFCLCTDSIECHSIC